MVISPTFVTEPPRRLVGMSYFGRNENQEIPQLWDRFIPRHRELEQRGGCYGASRASDKGPMPDFEYLAGFESESEPPEGMEAWDLPGGEYAKVDIAGLEEIHSTIQAFHQEWLPQSDYTYGGVMLEFYPDCFPENPGITLLFPVKKKGS